MAKAGKIQPFDPKAFDRMRGDIKQQQAMDKMKTTQQAAAAAKKPPAPKPKDQMQIGEKEVFGLRARRDMANRLGNK